MSVLAVPAPTRDVIRRHISPDPPIDCFKELAERIRARDFGWGFFACLSTVVAWACAWADGQFVDPAVFGQGETAGSRSELYSVLVDLEEAITGQPPTFAGPITDAIIGKLITELLERLLQNTDIPAWIADLIKGLLS